MHAGMMSPILSAFCPESIQLSTQNTQKVTHTLLPLLPAADAAIYLFIGMSASHAIPVRILGHPAAAAASFSVRMGSGFIMSVRRGIF